MGASGVSTCPLSPLNRKSHLPFSQQNSHSGRAKVKPGNIDGTSKKIQFLSGNDKPLLLKNPYDFANFLFIKQMFPSAKFVFIHRNPLKTISSLLNAMRMIINEKNPYLDINKLAVLTAVNVVHDYMKLQEKYEILERQLKEKE